MGGDFQTLEAWVDEKFPGMIENFGLSFIHEPVSDHKHGNQFFRMKWWLWDISTVGVELLLSDRPLIITGPLAVDSTVVALPIEPCKCFLGTRSSRTAEILRSQRPQILAARINESSLAQAKKRVIARSEQPRRFIENRTGKRAMPFGGKNGRR